MLSVFISSKSDLLNLESTFSQSMLNIFLLLFITDTPDSSLYG